jgi:hypothetical protein
MSASRLVGQRTVVRDLVLTVREHIRLVGDDIRLVADHVLPVETGTFIQSQAAGFNRQYCQLPHVLTPARAARTSIS